MLRFITSLLIIICISSTVLASSKEPGSVCKDKPDGITKDYYEDGKLKTEWICKYGQLHGISKLYYPNGQLEKALSYRNDVKQGPTYVYFENGSKKSVYNYKDGKLNGIQKIYYENGQIKEVTIYRDGVNQGDGGDDNYQTE